MKYRIKSIIEEDGLIKIAIDHEFGEEIFRLNQEARKIDFKTGKPKFFGFIEKELKKKYSNTSKPKEIMSDYVDQEFEVNNGD